MMTRGFQSSIDKYLTKIKEEVRHEWTHVKEITVPKKPRKG
jgi:hypothetical protein